MSDWYGAVVVRLGPILPHPDPESTALEMTRVMQARGDSSSGIPVVLRKGEFREGELAVYVGMDAVVPTANSVRFGFLDSRGKPHRVRARRLRGTFSEGLLTPAHSLDDSEQPLDFSEGTDLTVRMGVTKYLPEAEQEPVEYDFDLEARDLTSLPEAILAHVQRPENGSAWCWATHERVVAALRSGGYSLDGVPVSRPTSQYHSGRLTITLTYSDVKKGGRAGGSVLCGNSESCPSDHLVPKYDLEALRKWGAGVFEAGEVVVAREKIHGANFRAFHDGIRLWVGSRIRWLRQPEDLRQDTWWKAATQHGLEEKLATAPGVVLYGEMFGQVQDLKYGAPPGEVRLAFFDAMRLEGGQYMSDPELEELARGLGVDLAPLAYRGPWDPEVVMALRNGPSLVAGAEHTREGVVVRPIQERIHPRLGRVVLKLVGEDYKTRK